MFSAIRVWWLTRTAQRQMRAGQFVDAVSTLTDLLERRPDEIRYWVQRAVCQRELKNYQAAYDDALSAIKLEDRDASIWELAGEMLGLLNQDTRALKAFGRALQIDPHRSRARLQRGSILVTRGRNQEAAEDFDHFVKRNPTSPDGFFWRAAARMNLSEDKAALSDIERCLALNPHQDHALICKARILGAMERPADAVATLDAALAAGTPLDDIIVDYSIQLMQAGRYQEALPLLLRCSKQSPGRGWLLRLAKVYAALGDQARAERERQAAARFPRESIESLRKTGVVRNGVLLQANRKIFQPGETDDFGLVLITFDDQCNVDIERLEQLASKIMDLKNRAKIKNPVLRETASIVQNELVILNRRQLIPEELSGGSRIYAADIQLYRDFLPDGYLTETTRVLPVVAEPGNTGRLEMLPWLGSRAAT